MEVKVKGKRIEEVEVEIAPTELFKGMLEYFGISELYNPRNGDCHWTWDESGNKLIEVVDISRHGTPNYQQTGREISDNIQIKAYMLLENVKKLMEEKENEKRFF